MTAVRRRACMVEIERPSTNTQAQAHNLHCISITINISAYFSARTLHLRGREESPRQAGKRDARWCDRSQLKCCCLGATAPCKNRGVILRSGLMRYLRYPREMTGTAMPIMAGAQQPAHTRTHPAPRASVATRVALEMVEDGVSLKQPQKRGQGVHTMLRAHAMRPCLYLSRNPRNFFLVS